MVNLFLRSFPKRDCISSESDLSRCVTVFQSFFMGALHICPTESLHEGCIFRGMSEGSTHKRHRNGSDTLKYSSRPRQVILFPLISLTSRLSGLRSHGISIFKFLMNSSSISTIESKFTINLKIQPNPPCHRIKPFDCLHFPGPSGKCHPSLSCNLATPKTCYGE